MKNKILIKRLGLITVEKGKHIDLKRKIIFLSGISSIGFQIKNLELYNDTILNDFDEKIQIMTEMRGGNLQVPLFEEFPKNIPQDDEYFSKRVLGFVGNLYGLFREGKELDNGIVIPDWLFDLNKFGADPITQFQDEKIFEKALERQKAKKEDSHIVWKELKIVYQEEAEIELFKYFEKVLYSKSSIKESLKAEIEYLLAYFGLEKIDFKKIVFKEILTFVTRYIWDEKEYEILEKIVKTPTDLLRLFASISNTDISLSRKIRFPKFNRAQRKFILNFLEQKLSKIDNLFEKYNVITDEIVKYDRLWISVAEYIHPGEYSKQFPKTYLMFDKLRNGKIITYNSILEKAISEKNIHKVIYLLIEKPGLFARKLHEILEKSGKKQLSILSTFEEVGSKLQVKNLLVMKKYFETIDKQEKRTIINKKGKIKVLENRSKNIPEKILRKLGNIIDKLIVQNIKTKAETENKSWKDKKIFIEKGLDKVMIPLSQRKASDATLSVGRGTRIKVRLEDTMRLFVYWKQKEFRTDLDLSLIRFDEDLNLLGHVSYTNLQDGKIVHSGDIQSAEFGASEFIDIDFSTIVDLVGDRNEYKTFFAKVSNKIFGNKGEKLENATRYLVPQIYRYAGEEFDEIICYSGWMIRKDTSSDFKTFDPKTVQNKFDVNGKGSYVLPFIVDLYDEEIIFIDLFMNALTQQNRVEGAFSDILTVIGEVIKMSENKPNIKDLATYNTKALEGKITTNRDEADIVFGLHDGDYNLQNNVEKILNELI